MTGNKMAEVAALFGKKLGERFTIQDMRNGGKYGATFTIAGLDVCGAENPFLDLDCYFLESLLIGSFEIVDEQGSSRRRE